jgi:hypothetical protein
MPALTIRYKKSLSLSLSNNAIRFTESSLVGHRVQIPISVDDLNTFFVWRRTSGSARPIGHFLPTVAGINFSDVLLASLNKSYNDIDGTVDGLNFSSYILDANGDSRVREKGSVSANDLVMAYILYKCYGTSASPTMNIVYNLEDAQCMLQSESLSKLIIDSFKEEELLTTSGGIDMGAVDAMFRSILSLNPLRYFQANGTQIPGLFETNYICHDDSDENPDPPGTGSWMFMENDKLELRMEFAFPQPVSHISADDAGNKETVVIPAGTTFAIRLQLLAVDTPSGSSAKRAAAAAAAAAVQASRTASLAAAAQAASTFAAMAEQERQQAAYITTQDETFYANAVYTNSSQAIAASNAQAIANAAQAALEQAITSGSTDAHIQAQRTAAIQASAAAATATSLSNQAAAALQVAINKKAAAQQTLNTAQKKLADAVAASATANSITAADALAKAQTDATTIAATKAAADAASDPLTKSFTDAQQKILDPQTVILLQTAYNSAEEGFITAWTDFVKASDIRNTTGHKLDNITSDINYALISGKKEGEIQLLRSQMIALTEKYKTCVKGYSDATLALIKAQGAYKLALDTLLSAKNAAATEKKNNAALSVNETTAKAATATADLSAAVTANSEAQAAYTAANTALAAAISAGAIMSEVQALRLAVITTGTTASNTAIALAETNTRKLTTAAAAAAAVQAKEVADAAASAATTWATSALSDYNTRVSNITTFEQNVINAAETISAAKALNDAHVRLVNLLGEAEIADAAYDVAKRNLDVSPSSLALNAIVISALANKTAARAAASAAQVAYDTQYIGIVEDANSKEILEVAVTDFANSVQTAKNNTLAQILYSAIGMKNTAKAALDVSESNYMLAKNALDVAITSGGDLSNIRNLNASVNTTRNLYNAAVVTYNTADSAVTTAQANVSASPDVLATLQAAALLQAQGTIAATSNAMVKTVTDVYESAAAAVQAAKEARAAYDIAASQLKTAVTGGASFTEIQSLQKTLQTKANTLALTVFKSVSMSITLTNQQLLAQQDPSAQALINNTYMNMDSATEINHINTLQQAAEKRTVAAAAATTAVQQAQAEYDVIYRELVASANSGKNITDIQERLTTASNKLSTAKQAETFAIAARQQAVLDVSGANVQNKVLIQTAITSLAATTAAIVTERANLNISIEQAKANKLTTLLTQAQIDLNTATIAQEAAQKEYDVAEAALEAAIESGNNLKFALESEKTASANLIMAKSALATATAAYNSARVGVTEDPNVAAILLAAYDAATAAMNAKKQAELLTNLNEQKALLLVLKGEYDNAYAIYIGAKILLSAPGKANDVNALDNFSAAAAALVLINSKVAAVTANVESLSYGLSISPEQQAIYSAEVAHQAVVAAAQLAAVKKSVIYQQKQYLDNIDHQYKLADEAYIIAKKELDDYVEAGVINNVTIEELRNKSAETLVKRDNLKITLDDAQATYAASLAELDPIAAFIFENSQLVYAASAAQAQLNADLLEKDKAEENLVVALANVNTATAALTAAQAAEEAAVSGGAIPQEIVELQAATKDAADALVAAQIKYSNLQKFLLQAQDAYDASASRSTDAENAATSSTSALPNVLNGFIYSSIVSDYVLLPIYIPDVVVSGVPFTLNTQTVTPTNNGVYDVSDPYSVGKMVNYPGASDPSYICLTLNPISAKNPVAFPTLWKKIADAVLIYDPITDLSLTLLPVTGTNNRIVSFTTPTGLDDARISPTLLNSFAAFGTGIQTPDSIQIYSFNRVTSVVTISFNNYINQSAGATFYIKNGKSAITAAIAAAAGASIANAEASTAAATASAISAAAAAASLTTVSTLYAAYNTVLGFAVEARGQATTAGTSTALDAATAAEAAAERVRLLLVAAQAAQLANYTSNGFVFEDISGGVKRVLYNSSLLPSIITPGNAFTLGGNTIIPDAAPTIYSTTLGYTAGNVVFYTDGCLYMCIVGPTIQENGTTVTSPIVNTPPAQGSALWVKIAEAGDGVTGYEDINFSGSGLFLYIGQYSGTRYINGFDTWTLSSFTIPSNVKIVLYSEPSYGGLYRILTESSPNFQSLTTSGMAWNDKTRSVKIMYSTQDVGKPYESYVYNSSTDLEIVADSVYTDGDGNQRIRWLGNGDPVYDLVPNIGTSTFNQYIIFGTGVLDNSVIYQTLNGLASDGVTNSYEFVINGSVSTDITKTFYIRLGKSYWTEITNLLAAMT